MLTQLKDDFDREGIDITQLPLTMDSAFVSQALRQRLHQLGFTQIIIAGTGCIGMEKSLDLASAHMGY